MVTAPAAFAGVTQTFVLGTSNTPSFASQDMAHLTIAEVGNNTVWTLAADWDNALNTRNPFIFGLQFTDTKTASPVNFNATNGTIVAKSLSATAVNFLTANKAGRFTDGEVATWTFNNTKLTDFSAFELHVNSVTANGGSVKFTKMTSAVPEPETYGMLLAGLGLIGFAARRRAAK
ncbi:FxDxF family PEP-CTERM protein [Duganella sp. CF402]|uniref:FxDxF family PEP-CTERM protein n=2 Tax=unclassified Duganella TaxID=2636909 RepID=UPI0035A3A1CD